MDYLYDSFNRKVDVLSKALEKATERSRTMLYVVTFFSILVLVASFNAYWSWDRKLNAKERVLLALELNLIHPNELAPHNDILAAELRNCNCGQYQGVDNDYVNSNIAKIVHDLNENQDNNTYLKQALKNYLDSLEANDLLLSKSDYFRVYWDRQKFTIPILGLSCYADDIYLVGGLCLSILLTYSFFSIRREARTLTRMKIEMNSISKSTTVRFISHSNQSQVDLDLIKHNTLERIFYSCVEFFIFNTGQIRDDYGDGHSDSDGMKKTNKVGRKVLKLSYWFPLISLSYSFSLDLFSLYQRIQFVNTSDTLELGLRYFFAVGFILVVAIQSYVINKINWQNSSMVDEMFEIVRGSRKKVGLE